LFSIHDFEGRFVELNAQWCKTLGFSLAEIKGSKCSDFVHPDDVASTEIRIKSLLESHAHKAEFKSRYLKSNGSHLILCWKISIDYRDQLIYAVARDVTEEKNLAQERRELQNRLQAISEISTDYAYEFFLGNDGGGRLTWELGKFENITGFSGNDITKTGNDIIKILTSWSIVEPYDLSYCISLVKKILAGEEVDQKITIQLGGKQSNL